MSAEKQRDISRLKRLDSDKCRLLSKKICKLSLTIRGTHLEKSIAQLYRELENAGVLFKPKAYLSDEWGCPHGYPVIGIPFYLANPELHELEGQLTDIEAENDAEIMMYLRHEAGHAFNYAYRLYASTGWRRLFGTFSKPYDNDFRPVPFSPRFVRHIPGWYSQKHPDEDFAETFAVWLTPGSLWRNKYAGTPALKKLMYVEKIARRYGRMPPKVTDEEFDMPVEKMTMTLDSWYHTRRGINRFGYSLHPVLNHDLQDLFPDKSGGSAWKIIQENRIQLINDVNRWTGINRELLGSLVNEILARVRTLKLRVESENAGLRQVGLTAFITTLAMNYVAGGHFIEELKRVSK